MQHHEAQMPYISRRQLAELRDILEHVSMKRANFDGMVKEFVTVKAQSHLDDPPKKMTIDELIKARTKLWRDSWVGGPLDKIIRDIERFDKE
jgi:hypothetical protein